MTRIRAHSRRRPERKNENETPPGQHAADILIFMNELPSADVVVAGLAAAAAAACARLCNNIIYLCRPSTNEL